MKLKELSAKPQLIEITLSNESVKKKYGEEVSFHTYDRQPMDVFMKLANANDGGKPGDVIDMVKDLILDEEGKQIITKENTLPTDVMILAVGAIVERLGKL
jgi:hypothetical protein